MKPKTRRPARAILLAPLALLLPACAAPVPARYLGEVPPSGAANVVEQNHWSLVMHGPSSDALEDTDADFDWTARRDDRLSRRDACDSLASSAWPAPHRPRLSDERYRSFRRGDGYTYYRRSVTEEYVSHHRGSYRRVR